MCEQNLKIQAEINIHREFEKKVVEKAVARAKLEGLDKHDRFAKEGGDYYGKPLEKFVMDRMSYYMCFKCKEPYFGGMKDCGQGGNPQ